MEAGVWVVLAQSGEEGADTVGMGLGVGDGLQDLLVLVLDPVSGDVLGDLGVDGLLVLLVELDDLFDGLREVAGW